MRYFTLDLFRIDARPISDDEIEKGLQQFFPNEQFMLVGGFVGFIDSNTFQPLCFRNLNGIWTSESMLTLYPNEVPSVHFLGVNPSQSDLFRKAFPDRMSYTLRQFRVSVSV